MKAKNIFVLGLSAISAIALAACGEASDLDARKEAVKKVANQGICTSGGDDLIAGTETRLAGGATLSLAKQSQAKVNGKTYTVDIAWSYDEATYSKVVKTFEDDRNDPTHLYVGFNYSLEKEQAFALTGVLNCGEEASATVSYSFVLSKMEITFTEMTHTEFYHVDNETNPTKFDNWQNDEGRQKDYYYNNGHNITVYGKLTYVAQDGNFAYLSNGDKVLALYHTELSPDKTLFVEGAYLKMGTYIASYYGYPQLSNQIMVENLTADEKAAKVVEPTEAVTPVTLTGKQMNGVFGTDAERINQFSAWHHRMAKIRGTYVAGSLDGTGKTDGKNRFTFKILAEDGTQVTIQHNYHVDNKSGSIGKPIIDVLNSAGSHTIEVTGALTYASPSSAAPDSFKPGNEGGWTLTPLAANAVQVIG